MMIDWHVVAVGSLTILVMVLGWVWTSTSNRVDKNVQDLIRTVDDHVKEDTLKFAEVLQKQYENHIEILRALPKRKDDT